MKRQPLPTLLLLLSAGLIVLGMESIASACPGCKNALSEGEQGDLARGIYYSVLFMMSMPFAIVGTWAGLIYRTVKRAERANSTSQTDADRAES